MKWESRPFWAYTLHMAKTLYLLDGMALIYRAHFAFAQRPIFTSKGVNTSALYGFVQTLLEILETRKPTHLAVACDTSTPTARHIEYPEYKAQREEMPEDIRFAIPHVRRFIEAFNIPFITCEGYEADDIMGTLSKKAEFDGFETYLVTPDKDFGQLVSDKTFIYKPSRMGEGVDILGVPEILAKWGIQQPSQVIDVLGLWGDASDNIPGVPGIGEKTAAKLVTQFGSVEQLLTRTAELKGKQKENLETFRDQAMLSKRLATIDCQVPCALTPEELGLKERHEEMLKRLCIEFEFNAIGRRLFGDGFKAGHGYDSVSRNPAPTPAVEPVGEFMLIPDEPVTEEKKSKPIRPDLKTIADVPHQYHLITTAEQRQQLIQTLSSLNCFCFDTETTGLDVRQARLVGLAFSFAPQTGWYVAMPAGKEEYDAVLAAFRPLLEDDRIEKVGHNLKFDLSVLKWHGIAVRGRLFDTMIAHSLIEPEMRHGMDYLSEVYLGYSPVPITQLIGDDNEPQLNMSEVSAEKVAEYAAEDADVTWQLRDKLQPLLKERGQERVYYEIEAPLIPVLVDMEYEGIRVDAATLAEFSTQLAKEMNLHEQTVYRLAGREFNLNSPKQLGEVLFDELKIGNAPKKTRTGQYSTNEQTLIDLAPEHEIVRELLEFRTTTKLKSTYADALPTSIWPKSGRVHTTFNQAVTTTGRLNSQNPNLQNIPIRTEKGKEIRKAFIPRDANHVLLSADYSQIELRIIAALSHETGMLEAFRANLDIHTATAAKVYGVTLEQVTPELRRKAKMVNFGIVYGISAFGLAQRLHIPRKEAASIIDQYFGQYPGIGRYMRDTIDFCRKHGYVQTVTGRRRYLRDITSANGTVRGAAERNAINAPIQGSAADMIKLAMAGIHQALLEHGLKTKMLLQVHDELVFDVPRDEVEQVKPMIRSKMETAIPLEVPILVELGLGQNWLEAH